MSSNDRVFDKILLDVDQFQHNFAEEFEKRLKQRTPVNSGKLRDGWERIVTADAILVQNKVKYATYVENGTEHMAGAHMLKTTKSESSQIAKKAANKAKK